jgi:hypothetical protein
MYKSAELHLGIDTIKFKLELMSPEIKITDALDLLKDKISTALNNDETECLYYVPDQRSWIVNKQVKTIVNLPPVPSLGFIGGEQEMVGEYPACRFYHLGKSNGDMYVEVYGMFQAYDGSIIELSETHATILELLSKLHSHFDISITKIDMSIDYFYDYKKSYIWFYSTKSKENDINKIKKQKDHDISYRGRFPMHTIEAPIGRTDILEFIEKNKRKIKRKYVGKGRPEGSYFRFGTFKAFGVYKSFAECEEKDDVTTHVQLKINDKNLFYKVKELFKGQENWSYDFDETEDVKLSKSQPKSTWVSYDKMQRDEDSGKKDSSEAHTHNPISMEYANNDEELAEDLNWNWKHSRLELRLLRPGGKRKRVFDAKKKKFKEVTPPPLDPTDEDTYQKIFKDLEGRIKPIKIVLIKQEVPNGVYINHCRDMQKLQKMIHKENQKELKIKREKKGKEFMSTEFKPKIVEPKRIHGRMLKPIDYTDSIKRELNNIKAFFVK